jgi:hypothetical protein
LGEAALAFLGLLFLASAAYVVFGGIYEGASTPEAAISMAAVALEPANADGAPRKEEASGSSAKATGYFPATYFNRGRECVVN